MNEVLLLNGAIFLSIGAFAGLMSGILGIGGGIIVVPGLALFFQRNNLIPADAVMHVAAGTSLAVMIMTSLASLWAHRKNGGTRWDLYQKLWPGIICGVILGSLAADFVSTYWLKIIFGIFLLLIGLKMLLDWKVTHHDRFPSAKVNNLVCLAIGFKSGLLGVGGGVLIIPYLSYCGVAVRKIAPVSNLCTLTVAIIGSMMFILTGYREMSGISYATGYVYWPAVIAVAIPSMVFAPLGVRLNYLLPTVYLKSVFLVVLFATAFKMLS